MALARLDSAMHCHMEGRSEAREATAAQPCPPLPADRHQTLRVRAWVLDVSLSNGLGNRTSGPLVLSPSTDKLPRVYLQQLISVSVSIVDLCIAHSRKASNAPCTLAKREKKSFQVPAKTVKRNVTDLRGNDFQAAGPATAEKARRQILVKSVGSMTDLHFME